MSTFLACVNFYSLTLCFSQKFLFLGFFLFSVWFIWCLIDCCLDEEGVNDDIEQEVDIVHKLIKQNDHCKDIYLEKYKHLNSEITRYRDLSWQIAALAWGMYYALNWLVTQKCLYFNLPREYFFFYIFLIASSSTIFLLFCEHSTIRNKRQRRIIEGAMGMSVLRYTYLGEDTGRPSFIFSVGVFILAIWLPVISMCLFQN